MMRFKETQTRYFPEPVPAIPESNIQVRSQFVDENQHLIYTFLLQSHFVVGPELVEKDGGTNSNNKQTINV